MSSDVYRTHDEALRLRAEDALGHAVARALAALRAAGRAEAADRAEKAASDMDRAVAFAKSVDHARHLDHPPPLETAIFTLGKAYLSLLGRAPNYAAVEMFASLAIEMFDNLETRAPR